MYAVSLNKLKKKYTQKIACKLVIFNTDNLNLFKINHIKALISQKVVNTDGI